jgi:HD-like signal output (HDOD) protein
MVDIRTFKYLLANKIAGHKLPVIRSTTAQLVALLTNPHSDLKSIATSVLRDQSLTARVLSVANSVYYRRQDEHITSISRAVLQLGRVPLRDIAIASEFVEFTQKQASGTPNIRRLLAKSFVAAHQAMALGRAAELPEGEALFTSTLLNSLGELTLAALLPTVAQEIEAIACAEKLSYDEAHFQVTGLLPHEVTAIVAERIKIPQELLLPPPNWDRVLHWTNAEQRQAIVHLANAWAGNLLLIRVGENFDQLMAQTAQAFSLPGALVATALTEGFHNALEAGATINLDADCFAIDMPSAESGERIELLRSCARVPKAVSLPTPARLHPPVRLPSPGGSDLPDCSKSGERDLSFFARLVTAFSRLVS